MTRKHLGLTDKGGAKSLFPPDINLRSVVLKFLFTVAITLFTLWVRVQLSTVFEQRPAVAIFMFPIILSAYVGGLWAGVLSTLLSIFSVNFFLVAPLHSLETSRQIDYVQMWILIVNGVLVSILNETLHRAQKSHEKAKEELERSEEKYRTLVETADDAILLTDINGNHLYRNNAYYTSLGFGVGDNVDLDGFPNIHPEDRPRTEQVIQELLKTGTAINEYRIKNKDGQWRYRQAKIVTQYNKEHEPEAFLSIIRDITDRKQAEERLRLSEQTLSLFVKYAPASIAMFNREMKYIAYSRRYIADYNLKDENILGQSHYDVFPDMPERWKEIHRRCLAGAIEKREEDPFPRADGTTDWVRWEIRPWRDQAGEIGGIILFSEVVTERKQAEQAIRISEEKFRSYTEYAPLGILVLDRDGKFIDVNPEAERLFDYPRAEILEQTVYDLMAPGYKNSGIQSFQELIGKGSITRELVLQRKDLSTFPAFINAVALSEQNFMAFIQDITERKQGEKLLVESEERYRNTLNNMLEGCQIIDYDWRYVYINEAAAKQGHSTPEALLTRTMMECYPGIENTKLFSVMSECMEKRTARHMENEFTYPDGGVGWFELSIQPVIEGIFILSVDITERKQAAEHIQSQFERLNSLHAIDIAINSSVNLNSTLDIVLQQVSLQLKVDACAILLFDSAMQTFSHAASLGFRTNAIHLADMNWDRGLTSRVVRDRRTVHIPNLIAAESDSINTPYLANESFLEYYGTPLIVKGEVKGVLEVYHRSRLNTDQEWLDFMQTLAGQAAIAVYNSQLFSSLQRSNLDLGLAYDATIEGWSKAMDLRDRETEGHTLRVTDLTLKLASVMGISQTDQVHIRRGALLHDIGKLGVPDQILFKQGPLTEEEWEIMRRHPTYAFDMILPITYLRPALDIPYSHHEKWDGSGYPRSLRGEQIPLAARLFAVIDVWDALRSDRSYREGWSYEATRQYIIEQSGKHFDPQVVEAFIRLLKEENIF